MDGANVVALDHVPPCDAHGMREHERRGSAPALQFQLEPADRLAQCSGTLQRLLGRLPLRIEAYELAFDADLDAVLPDASAALRRADSGEGVLILTDLYGASPSNLAARLTQLGTPARRVTR